MTAAPRDGDGRGLLWESHCNYGNLGTAATDSWACSSSARPRAQGPHSDQPHHAAQSFLKRLVIHNWQHIPRPWPFRSSLSVPQAYAKWEVAASASSPAPTPPTRRARRRAAHAAGAVHAPGK
jgi:hypothetical protein